MYQQLEELITQHSSLEALPELWSKCIQFP